MLAAILLSATLWQERTVTFTHPCAHSAVILRALGREVGITLTPRGSVDQDYFLVRFEGLPVQVALNRIAETLNATWIGEGAVRYLDRTREDLIEENDVLFRVIEKFLADNPINPYPAMGELVSQLASANSFDRSDDSDPPWLRGVGELSPLKRALTKVLNSFSKDDIQEMSSHKEVEFRARPLEFERPYTKPMADAIQVMLAEFRVLREAAVRAGVDPSEIRFPSYIRLLEPANLESAHFRFVVELNDKSFAVRMKEEAIGPYFGAYYGIESIGASRSEYRMPPFPELEGTDVPFVEKSEHLAFFKSLDWPGSDIRTQSFRNLAPWTQRALLNLDTYEPLGMRKSDVLLQLAELKGWDMVALLEDGALIPYSFDKPGDLAEESEWIFNWHAVELKDDEGFLSITPYDPRNTRQDRWDRKRISQAFRHCKSRNWFDMEARAMVLGAHEEGINAADIEQTIETLFRNRLGSAPPGVADGGLFELYAALPENFRQQARLGPVTAPAATMDESVRSIVRKRLRRGGFRDKDYVDPYPSERWYPDSIYGEESVPDRYLTGPLPEDVVIELIHERRNSFIGAPVVEGFTTHGTGLMSTDELATDFLYAREHGLKPDCKRVMLVPSEKVTLKISLPKLEFSATFVTSGAALTDGFVTHDRLPPAVRVALRNAIVKRGG